MVTLQGRPPETEEALSSLRSRQADAPDVSDERGFQSPGLQGVSDAFRAIVEAMRQGAVVVAADGVILYCNESFARLATTPREAIAGTPISDLFVPGDRLPLKALMNAGRQPVSAQLTMLSREGMRAPLLADSSPLPMGGAKSAVCLVVTDLSDQKRNEQVLAAERLASAMLEQAAEAIVVCDADGTVIRANHEAHLLCGASPLGQPFHEVFHLRLTATGGPAVRASSSPSWLRGLAQGVRLHSVDGTLLRPNGEIRNVLISLGPLQSGHRFLGRVVTLADITGRRRAEEALQESEARLTRLTASTPAYIYEVDRDGKILFANNVYQGLSLDQVKGTRYADWFPQDQRRAVQETLDTCLATGAATETEFTVPDLTGKVQRFLVQMTPSKSGDSRGTVVVTGTDISKLREAEEDRERLLAQLAAEKARWQTTVESMLDPVTVSDAQGHATYMNAAYSRMVNLTIQDGLDLEQHPEYYRLCRPDGTVYKAEDLPLQKAALTGQEVRGEELVQRDPDGGEHWAVWNAAPLRDDQGRVTGAVAVGRDITDQRRAEAERERLLARLQVEQGRLRAIIENAPEAILVTDADGRIVLSNPVADRLYGRPVPYGLEFESQAQFTLCLADGTPCPPDRVPLTRSALEGTTTKSAEMVIVWKDGHWRDLLVSTAPIRDAEGELSGAVGVLQDITELEQAKRDLQRRTDQLETVRQVGLHLSAELELGALLRTIVAQAVALLHVDGGVLYLFRPERDLLETVVEIGDSFSLVGRLVRRGEGAPGLAWETGKPSRVTEGTEAPAGSAQLASFSGAAAAVPVNWGDEFLGVIAASRKAPTPLSEADVEALELVAAQAAIAIRNARVVAQEADQRRRAEALTQATAVLASTLDLEELLRRLLSAGMAAIPSADRGAVLLLDKAGERLVARTQVGYATLRVGESAVRREENPLLWGTLEGKSVLVPDVEGGSSGFVSLATEQRPPQSAVLAPLRYRGGPIGVLVLTNFSRKSAFGAQDLQLLSAFADQAAVAVENARLYEDAQGKAVLEERQRLARALHDSVTQSLYSLTLFTQTAQRRASAGDLERVQENLRQVSETAAQSLKDMRLLVYELRRTDLEQIGLVAALLQRLNSVEKRAGVDARLDAAERLDLPAWAEEALYSIASEAMNNSLKHAAASALQVSVRLADNRVDLQVSDNGLGFDLEAARRSGGLGLTSMRERTEQAGGTLTIDAETGKGTTVKVSLPLAPDGRSAGLPIA
jgi:PAS domain S-box-containing protein